VKHSLVVEKVGDARKLRILFLFNDVLVCAGQKKSLKYDHRFFPSTDLFIYLQGGPRKMKPTFIF